MTFTSPDTVEITANLKLRKTTLCLFLLSTGWSHALAINAYLSRLERFLPVYIFSRCCKLKITPHRSPHILRVPPVSLANSPFCPFHPDWARWGGGKKEINNRAKWERSEFNRVSDWCVKKGRTLKQEAGGEAMARARRLPRWRSNLQASIGPVCVGEGILEKGLGGYQISPIRVCQRGLCLAQGQHVSEMRANDSVKKNT